LSKLSNLQQRIVTGGIGALLLVAAVYFGAYSFGILFLTIMVLAQWEFYSLIKLDTHSPLAYLGTFIGILVFGITFGVQMSLWSSKVYLALFPIFTWVYFVKLYRLEAKPFTNIAYTFLGILYVALPFTLFQIMAFREGSYRWEIAAGFLFLLWASDTGAFFAGTVFGRRKLFERISPKKSWEGSLGGLITSLLVSVYLGQIFDVLEPWKWIVCSLMIVIAGTYGDLVESLFKRSIAIKDSGTFLPGHGGFLDRFDGLLLSSPYIAAFLSLT
jgi:phosphatidate cytidylyltransferase